MGGCSSQRLVLQLRSIFCPGVRSPFPCIRLMFFYPRDLGTKIINDPGFDLAMKAYSEALSVGIENKNVKNYGGWYFNLFMLLGM